MLKYESGAQKKKIAGYPTKTKLKICGEKKSVGFALGTPGVGGGVKENRNSTGRMYHKRTKEAA